MSNNIIYRVFLYSPAVKANLLVMGRPDLTVETSDSSAQIRARKKEIKTNCRSSLYQKPEFSEAVFTKWRDRYKNMCHMCKIYD
jgi:hypothetical protein